MTTISKRPKLFETKNKHTTVSLGITKNTNAPALRILNKQSGQQLEAIRSKLVKNPNPVPLDKKQRINADMSYVDNVANDTGMSISEARGLLDALPDLELSKQIIVSSILSPNDMLQSELIYGCDTKIFAEVTQPLVNVIKDYFDNTYKIKKLLPEMIGKAIFTDGAYPMAIFPESTIDNAINSNLKMSRESVLYMDEQINRNLGILGNPDRIVRQTVQKPIRSAIMSASFESIHNDTKSTNYDPVVFNPALNLTVTDNPLILRAPKAMAKMAKNKIIERYASTTVSAEFYSGIGYATDNTNQNIDTATLYPNRTHQLMPVLDMNDIEGNKENVGHPIVFTPPTESVIPVYEPGSPHIHIGYFIALDETGNPLSTAEYDDQFRNLQAQSKSASSGSSAVGSYGTGGSSTVNSYNSYKDVAGSVLGTKDTSTVNAEEAARQYAAIVEAELAQRLKNGDYNETHTVAKATRIYRMMFTRACQTMHTQLLYVPIEFMTYLAYDYKHNGVGRSLLDKTKSIASLRMVNLIADSIASIKNSINYRDLDLVIDPNDPDPLKTIEQYLDEYQKATNYEFPVGMISMSDITESFKKAGISVSVSGHPGIPETSMKVNYSSGGLAQPDKDFDDRLQKRNIMAFGIPPDSVNSAAEMEFAKNAVIYNHLSAKINNIRQEITCEHISDFMRKYTRNSSILVDSLTRIITKNRESLNKQLNIEKMTDRDLALYFINYISVSLPKPDTSKIENELENFNKYKEALEAFLEAFISDELLSSAIVGEEVSGVMTSLIPIIKGYFLRRYLATRNVMPELFTLVATGEMENENFDIFEQHEEYVKGILPAFRSFIIKMLETGTKTDGMINAAKEIISNITGTEVGESDNTSEPDDNNYDESESDEGDDDDEFDAGDSEESGEDDDESDSDEDKDEPDDKDNKKEDGDWLE